MDDGSNATFSSISAVRKVTGVYYFEVPQNSKEIELEYEDDYWTSSKMIFTVA